MKRVLVAVALFLSTRSAAAQESIPIIDAESKNPGWACHTLGIVDIRPAVFELGPWWQVGGGLRSEQSQPLFSLGGGVDGTFGTEFGAQRKGGRLELRAGPWLGFETPLDRFRAEGGLTLIFGQAQHARLGTLGLRAGVGYGTGYESGAASHLVVAVSYGIRYVQRRARPLRGPCVPASPPATVALASGARLFAAVRRGLAAGDGTEIVFGLELEPTWLLPPYSASKLAGEAR